MLQEISPDEDSLVVALTTTADLALFIELSFSNSNRLEGTFKHKKSRQSATEVLNAEVFIKFTTFETSTASGKGKGGHITYFIAFSQIYSD